MDSRVNESISSSEEYAPSPEPEPEPEAEPTAPDEGLWRVLWGLHYYTLGSIFLGLGIYALYSTIVTLSKGAGSTGRVSSIRACILAIKALLVLMGVSRATYMFLYRQLLFTDELWVKIVKNILANVAYPCLTGGFGLMCQILYEASRLKAHFRSTVLANRVVLLVVIVTHFVAVISAVTLIELIDHFVLTLLVCHGFFIVWGVFLIVTFIAFSRRLLETERNTARIMASITQHESTQYETTITADNLSSKYPGIDDGASAHRANNNVHTTDTPEADPAFVELENSKLKDTSSSRGKRANDGTSSPARTTKATDLPSDGGLAEKGNAGFCGNTGNGTRTPPAVRAASSPMRFQGKHRGNGRPQGGGVPQINGPVCVRPTAFRVKLTRKVMRIANATAILATCSVALNSLFVISDLVTHFYDWSPSQCVIYVFKTLFRLNELGLGFAMAYFTTQSIKRRDKGTVTWLKRITARTRKNFMARKGLSNGNKEPVVKTLSTTT